MSIAMTITMSINRGRYFEGDLSENLRYEDGAVILEASNLRLKRGTLDELGLSISVKRGFLKSLIIRISISTFNVDIGCHGLFVLVSPQHSSQHFDAAAHRRQQKAIRRSLLDEAERRMLATDWKFLEQRPSTAQKWWNQLTQHFVESVKVDVTDVHLRYQDTSTISGHPFVVGLTLKRLTAVNQRAEDHNDDDDEDSDSHSDSQRDSNADPNANDNDHDGDVNADDDGSAEHKDDKDGDTLTEGVISKNVTLESLSVYLNCGQFGGGHTVNRDDEDEDGVSGKEELFDSSLIWNEEMLSLEALIAKFEQIPSKKYRYSHYDYMLSPLSLSFTLFITEDIELYLERFPDDPSRWRPRIECKLNVERLRVSLTQKQLQTLQLWSRSWKYVLAKMELEEVLSEMKRERPPAPYKHEDRRAWWQYIARCIVSLHQKAKERSGSRTGFAEKGWSGPSVLELIRCFASNKASYCALYKRKMRPHALRSWLLELTPSEREELEELELTKLPMDCVLILRSLAIAELREEMNKRTDFMEEKRRIKSEEQSDSYLVTRMLWNAGSYAKSYVVAEEEHPEQYKLSQKETKDVIDTIDFDRTMERMKMPDLYTEARCALHFGSITVALLDDQCGNRVITELTATLNLHAQKRPRSTIIALCCPSLTLQSIDEDSADPLLRSIISKRTDNVSSSSSTPSTPSNAATSSRSRFGDYGSERVPSPFGDDDLIQIEVELNPLASTADSRIAVHLRPIQLVWNAQWIERMRQFVGINGMDSMHRLNQHHHQHLSIEAVGMHSDDERQHSVSPALSARSARSNASNISNASSVRRRSAASRTWTERGQQQLMSALVHRGRHEFHIECLHSIAIIPQSTSSNTKLLVAEIDTFSISNELPLKSSVSISTMTAPKMDEPENRQFIPEQKDSNHSNRESHKSLKSVGSEGTDECSRRTHRSSSAMRSPFESVRANPSEFATFLLKQNNCSLSVYDDAQQFVECGQRAARQQIIESFCFDITVHRQLSDGLKSKMDLNRSRSSLNGVNRQNREEAARIFVAGTLPQLHFTFSSSTMFTLHRIFEDMVQITKHQNHRDNGVNAVNPMTNSMGNTMVNPQGNPMVNSMALVAPLQPLEPAQSVLDEVADLDQKYQDEEWERELEKSTPKHSPFENVTMRFQMKQCSLRIVDDHQNGMESDRFGANGIDKSESSKYWSTPLVRLLTEELSVEFWKKRDDIQSKLNLRALFIEDLYQNTSPSFRYLVTSKVDLDAAHKMSNDLERDLISIDAKWSTKSKRTDILCAFNCVHIGWNPECVLAVHHFIDKVAAMRQSIAGSPQSVCMLSTSERFYLFLYFKFVLWIVYSV